MQEYVISICFAILFCLAADILVPSQKYRGILRIVCGIFVIGTVVSPIRELIKFDYRSFDTDIYLKDDYGFFSKVEMSRDSYQRELIQNGTQNTADMISKELESVFGEQLKAEFRDGSLILKGTSEGGRAEMASYVKKHYGLDAVFED